MRSLLYFFCRYTFSVFTKLFNIGNRRFEFFIVPPCILYYLKMDKDCKEKKNYQADLLEKACLKTIFKPCPAEFFLQKI